MSPMFLSFSTTNTLSHNLSQSIVCLFVSCPLVLRNTRWCPGAKDNIALIRRPTCDQAALLRIAPLFGPVYRGATCMGSHHELRSMPLVCCPAALRRTTAGGIWEGIVAKQSVHPMRFLVLIWQIFSPSASTCGVAQLVNYRLPLQDVTTTCFNICSCIVTGCLLQDIATTCNATTLTMPKMLNNGFHGHSQTGVLTSLMKFGIIYWAVLEL